MNYKKALLYAIPIIIGGFIIFRVAFAQGNKIIPTPKPDPNDNDGDDNFPLKNGSRGTRVRELQTALVKNDPMSLSVYGIDGVFGSETEAAVMAALGKRTVDNQAEIDKIKGGVSVSVFPLKRGSKGSKVKELQNALLKKNASILPKYGADGDFGSETESAVKTITGKTTVDSQAELDAIKK